MRFRGEKCSVDGCASGIYAREVCKRHYRRLIKGIPLNAPPRASCAAKPLKMRYVEAAVALADAQGEAAFQRAVDRFSRLVSEAAERRLQKRQKLAARGSAGTSPAPARTGTEDATGARPAGSSVPSPDRGRQ